MFRPKSVTFRQLTFSRPNGYVIKLVWPFTSNAGRQNGKKKVCKWKPTSIRTQGRPRNRCEDDIRNGMKKLKIKNRISCIQDRNKWKLYVEKAKTFKDWSCSAWRRRRENKVVTWCTSSLSTILHSAHTVFMCFVFIWEQTATSTPYNTKWSGFITEMKRVHSAVRTGSLNKAVCASSLKG